MAFERLSLGDDSLIASYADHIQRYKFALKYCEGKCVLDAGCGVGYGSHYLAANGAKSVLALDISEEAICEARQQFARQNLTFNQMDVERIGDDPSLNGKFDVIVNFENLEHLHNPQRLVSGAESILRTGVFITSTPNGAISSVDENGNPSNEFHVKEFTAQELTDILSATFMTVTLFGQWLTHQGKLRKLRARELFDQLNESYYNPMNRCGRIFKRLFGKRSLGPPKFTAAADSFDGDYVIQPLSETSFPWNPTVLIAICEKLMND